MSIKKLIIYLLPKIE